ncbi:DUF695 domain-containing protein [Undibacterium sp. LX40W]|uniref:DUF695 domain-containing protein n=1 Tax=Undibacterium nitidum TaxID=2762298 RepID=A0A923HV68_9BURK|nr:MULTISPECIES: DUF695 domain-containing protein [Undibacterium]MBC3881904.1 DUF695 domain-containing protein [Undibacterium nitidum]MBC3892099.1 DUF695 domain-containing protein [Undibacterium sp. LX40W]
MAHFAFHYTLRTFRLRTLVFLFVFSFASIAPESIGAEYRNEFFEPRNHIGLVQFPPANGDAHATVQDNTVMRTTSKVVGNLVESSFVIDDERFIVKRLAELPSRDVQLQYPIMVRLGLIFDSEGSHRLPNSEEAQRISRYEDALIEGAQIEDCLYVGAITSDGFHQFLFYCKRLNSEIKLSDHLPALRSASGSFGVWEVSEEVDESWSYAAKIQIK